MAFAVHKSHPLDATTCEIEFFSCFVRATDMQRQTLTRRSLQTEISANSADGKRTQNAKFCSIFVAKLRVFCSRCRAPALISSLFLYCVAASSYFPAVVCSCGSGRGGGELIIRESLEARRRCLRSLQGFMDFDGGRRGGRGGAAAGAAARANEKNDF